MIIFESLGVYLDLEDKTYLSAEQDKGTRFQKERDQIHNFQLKYPEVVQSFIAKTLNRSSRNQI